MNPVLNRARRLFALAAQGLKGFEACAWHGLVAPTNDIRGRNPYTVTPVTNSDCVTTRACCPPA
jgi:hypothetical protein